MSKLTCINCGVDNVFVARDMKSTRKCGSCSTTWTPDQDIEETDYKLLFNNESEVSKDLRIKLAKKDEIIKELKTFAVHHELCGILLFENSKCNCGFVEVKKKIKELER